MHRFRLARMTVFAAGLALMTPVIAAEFVVNRTIDSVDAVPGDGLCADTLDGGCSLRAAIIESNALAGADRVLLPPGLFMLSLEGRDEEQSLTGDLDVFDALELLGAGSEVSIIDAASIDSMLEVFGSGAGEVKLQGLTLRNGLNNRNYDFSTARGIGLTVHVDANLSVSDLVIRDQRSNSFSTALGMGNAGCVRGERLRIRDGRPASGEAHALSGGIVTRGATSCLDLTDVEISGNIGDQTGAIFATAGAPITLRRALISDNEARFSGAITLNGQNNVLLENVTISGNRGQGAILNDGGSMLRLVNATITSNVGRAGTPSIGGIADVHAVGAGTTRLTNTILAGNGPGTSADNCNHVMSEGGGNIIGGFGCTVSALKPTDQLDADPQLAALASLGGFTRVHEPGTAAIDRAADAACSPEDQRGEMRPQDGDHDGQARCDIGAMELADKTPDPLNHVFDNGFEPSPDSLKTIQGDGPPSRPVVRATSVANTLRLGR